MYETCVIYGMLMIEHTELFYAFSFPEHYCVMFSCICHVSSFFFPFLGNTLGNSKLTL